MSDLVHFGAISQETRTAWEALCHHKGWLDICDDFPLWITTEQAALLWFRLRTAEDKPEDFPKGKWASLQLFETLIDESVKE